MLKERNLTRWKSQSFVVQFLYFKQKQMFKSLKNDCKFTEWWKMFYSKGFGLIYLEQLVGKNQDNHLVSFSWRVDLFHWSKSKIKGDVAKWLFVVEQKSDKTKGKASQQYIKHIKHDYIHLEWIFPTENTTKYIK